MERPHPGHKEPPRCLVCHYHNSSRIPKIRESFRARSWLLRSCELRSRTPSSHWMTIQPDTGRRGCASALRNTVSVTSAPLKLFPSRRLFQPFRNCPWTKIAGKYLAKSVLEISLSRVSGYRCSHRGRNNAPFIRSITHAPDQAVERPRLLHCCINLAAPSKWLFSVASKNSF